MKKETFGKMYPSEQGLIKELSDKMKFLESSKGLMKNFAY